MAKKTKSQEKNYVKRPDSEIQGMMKREKHTFDGVTQIIKNPEHSSSEKMIFMVWRKHYKTCEK